jgi:hypothetical protein
MGYPRADDNSVRTSHSAKEKGRLRPYYAILRYWLPPRLGEFGLFVTPSPGMPWATRDGVNLATFSGRFFRKFPTNPPVRTLLSLLDIQLGGLLRSVCPDRTALVFGTSTDTRQQKTAATNDVST